MAGIIRIIDYGAMNGGWAPLVTQQRGSCLFHAVRRSIQCPKEFTNMQLRRMIVNFICDRVDELFPMLKVARSGNYGHLRLTQDEYNRKMADGTITDLEKEEFEEPGPFSIASYLETLLKPTFYGEEICLRIISMLFKIRISVLNGDTLIAIKVRHTNVQCSTKGRFGSSPCKGVPLYPIRYVITLIFKIRIFVFMHCN